MLSGNGNGNKNVGLFNKKQLCTFSTLLYIFSVVLYDYNRFDLNFVCLFKKR